MNTCVIIGNIASEIDSKQTQSGMTIATFSVACQRKYKDKDGNLLTDFFRIVCWRKTAEFVSKYLGKGRKVVVNGELQTRSYEKDGQKHTVVEINAQTVEALDRGPQKPSDGFMEVTDEMLPF